MLVLLKKNQALTLTPFLPLYNAIELCSFLSWKKKKKEKKRTDGGSSSSEEDRYMRVLVKNLLACILSHPSRSESVKDVLFIRRKESTCAKQESWFNKWRIDVAFSSGCTSRRNFGVVARHPSGGGTSLLEGIFPLNWPIRARLFLLAPRPKSRRHHINKGWAWFEATFLPACFCRLLRWLLRCDVALASPIARGQALARGRPAEVSRLAGSLPGCRMISHSPRRVQRSQVPAELEFARQSGPSLYPPPPPSPSLSLFTSLRS